MKQYFKLFTVSDGNQIMYERCSDDDNLEHICTSFYYEDGTKAQTKAGYGENSKKADLEFEKINQQKAQTWYDTMNQIYGG